MGAKKFTVKKQDGFTITETLVVIPIATILVVVLVSALFTQYTNALAESTRTSLRAAGQTILINLQDELLFTIAYGEQLEGRLSDPNEPSGGWSYDTTPQTLIINEIALDSTRRDDTRHVVRQRVSNCESSSVTSNPLAINNVVYFVDDIDGSDFDALYKRTITPSYNLCSIDTTTDEPCTPTSATCRGNAKRMTCPEALVGTGGCSSADSMLSDKVKEFTIRYYSEGNIETTFPSDAEKIEVELVLGDKVFGKEVEATVRHTIRKIN